MRKVAITGGLSCGKSLVRQYFNELGAYTIDADQIVHNNLTLDSITGKKIIELLGDSIVVDGVLDRKRIAKKVFLNPRLIKELEKILHPIVYDTIKNKYQEQISSQNPPPIFIAEVPLLFESAGEKFFDKIIVVTSDPEKRWERYRESTGYEREEFSRRSARQLSEMDKIKRADYVIANNGTREELQAEVKKLYNQLCH